MVDPVITPTAAVAVAGAWIAKEGVGKLLGPSFEYMGEGLKDLIEKRNEAAKAIAGNAIGKLGDKLDQPGQVPPKVLNTIFNDGTYATDPLAIEYFGGVLASSRSELGKDDRGDRMAKIVGNLSTYQLRAHYLIYTTISNLFKGQNKMIGLKPDRDSLRIDMSNLDFFVAMDFTPEEKVETQIMVHICTGLLADGLVDNIEHSIHTEGEDESDGRTVCSPSPQGVELFLWAHGFGGNDLGYILLDEFGAQFDGLPSGVLPQAPQ